MLRQHIVLIAILGSAALVLSTLLIIPYFTTSKAIQSDTQRRIVSFESKQLPQVAENGEITSYDTIVEMRYVRAGDIEPNSSVWFFNPFDGRVASELYRKPIDSFTKDEKNAAMEKIDQYAYYQLIRLPIWLGSDDENNTTAYRAYNAISLTQKCLAKYWPNEVRMRIEDPCAGDTYRSWDGFAFGGPAGQGFLSGFPGSRGTYQGLSNLELAIDNEGYLLALRPDTSPSSNGVPGEGRTFSADALEQSNQALIDAASSHIGYSLPFATRLPPDYLLADIRESNQFGDSYNVNSETESPVLDAAYVNPQSYEGIVITVAELDRFPSLGIESLTEEINGNIVPDLNNTDLRSFLGIYGLDDDYCYFAYAGSNVKIPYELEFGPGMAGEFSIFHSPDLSTNEQARSADDNFTCGSNVLIWGKSIDNGKAILVQIQTVDQNLERLQNLAKVLPIE